jgi:hypothetical protein
MLDAKLIFFSKLNKNKKIFVFNFTLKYNIRLLIFDKIKILTI